MEERQTLGKNVRKSVQNASIATSLRGTSRNTVTKRFVLLLKVLLGSSEVNQLFLDPGSAQRRRVRVIKSANSGDFPSNWVMTNWTSRGVHDKVKLYFYVLLCFQRKRKNC